MRSGFILVAAGLLSLAATLFSQSSNLELPKFRVIKVDGQREVYFAEREVTVAQWAACHAAGGCSYMPKLQEVRPDFPVTGINHFDALEYLTWLNRQNLGVFRLPTKAEWGAAASELPRPKTKKLFDDTRLAWAAEYGAMNPVDAQLKASGSFGTLSNGVADLAGNVWEWTSTCAIAANADNCAAYLVEGQHEAALSVFIRDPLNGGCSSGTPPAHVGLRVVTDTMND
jgi:formylglycine-generating enzyme required for sulfatase activity